jgi:malate/lactate dehydrogenase
MDKMIFIGVPCIIGKKNGVEEIVDINLNGELEKRSCKVRLCSFNE